MASPLAIEIAAIKIRLKCVDQLDFQDSSEDYSNDDIGKK